MRRVNLIHDKHRRLSCRTHHFSDLFVRRDHAILDINHQDNDIRLLHRELSLLLDLCIQCRGGVSRPPAGVDKEYIPVLEGIRDDDTVSGHIRPVIDHGNT